MVPPTYTGAVVVQPLGHNVTMAPPSQPCAGVAPTQRQGATVVPPTYKCVVTAPPPGQRATMAPSTQPCADMAPAQRLKDIHSDAPPWCYSCGTRPAPTEPGGTQATGGARDRVS